MRRFVIHLVVSAAIAATIAAAHVPAQDAGDSSDWSLNATVIEACSCTMFCPCYFSPRPVPAQPHHGQGEHFCLFNMGFQVNRGRYGDESLDGARFWLAGDLGADFSGGKTKWATLTFDPSVTEAQRKALLEIVPRMYPMQWESFQVEADRKIDWELTADKAVATLDGGKIAEVVLERFQGMTDEPVVIRNLRYWGVPRNDGFVLMPHTVNTYSAGSNAFEYRSGNGFVITVDIASADVKAPK